MGVKVHGNLKSEPTMRVLAALHEKELDFEVIPVDMQLGAHKRQPYLSLNPFGQVPAFEDGDIQLFESRAITSYIAHTYQSSGTPLVFQDMERKAVQDVWLEVEAHQFNPVTHTLCWELIFKRMLGLETDVGIVAEYETKLAKVLDVYEARLSQSKYLCGKTFTLVDLHHLPALHMLILDTQVKKLFEERQHVSAWCNHILTRPSWEKALGLQK